MKMLSTHREGFDNHTLCNPDREDLHKLSEWNKAYEMSGYLQRLFVGSGVRVPAF